MLKPRRFTGKIVLFMAVVLTLVTTLAGIAKEEGSGGRNVKPNPFTEGTEFELTIPDPGSSIKIDVYNLLGKHIRNLYPGVEGSGPQDHPPGKYPVPWDGRDKYGEPVPPGIYICVLYANNAIVKSVKVIKIEG